MASTALYRRYRPQTFSDVLGQDHVTETLQSAIREGRVGHAFLFSGSRGTGKTSTARILAKALNCEQGPTPEPCNSCSTCRAITEGSSLDVIEIDAASHGGVDDVRDLRENAVLAPAIARRKIYIIDEAHMVSPAGWNAFLKTVEEPPEHVIFVFATTEPHKVLPTILSRCQRFDFRRVSSGQIAEHLARVCKEEGIEADEAALQLIARASEGGVRDSLSTLDQLVSAGSVTVEDAMRLLGVGTGDALFAFTDALADGDTATAVGMIARLVEQGQDLRVFARTVVDHLRGVLLTKQIDDPGDLIDATEETRARLADQAQRISGGRLVHLLRLFVDAMTEMRQQAAPRLTVELAAIRATMPEVDDSAAGAIARIERLERMLWSAEGQQSAPPQGAAPQGAPSEPAPAKPPAVKPAPPAKQPPKQAAKTAKEEPPPTAAPHADTPPAAAVGSLDMEKVRRSWPVVLEEVRKTSRKLHSLMAGARPVSFADGALTLEVRFAIHGDMLAEPKNARQVAQSLSAVFGVAPVIRTVVAAQQKEDSVDDIDEMAIAEPAGNPIDVIKAGFGDVQIDEE